MPRERGPRTDWQLRMGDQLRRDVAAWRKQGLTAVEMFDVLGDIAEELSLEVDDEVDAELRAPIT